LLESYQVISFPFEDEKSDFFIFILSFPTHENMAKFSSSLFDKPFARSIGKVHGENGILVQIYLPRKEFRKLIDHLSALVSEGFLRSYRFWIQDSRFVSRQTIPYKLFADGAWHYDHEKHLAELATLLNSSGRWTDEVQISKAPRTIQTRQ